MLSDLLSVSSKPQKSDDKRMKIKSRIAILFIVATSVQGRSEQNLSKQVPNLKPNVTPVRGLYVLAHEFVSGKDCKFRFSAPEIKNNSCTQPHGVSKKTYQQYEEEFFESVRDQQLQEANCIAPYLELFDQNTAQFKQPDKSSSLKNNIQSVLAQTQNSKWGDPKSVLLQEYVLRDIYKKLPKICQKLDEVKKFEIEFKNAMEVKGQNQLPGKSSNLHPLPLQSVQRAESNFNQALINFERSRQQYFGLQRSIWSGTNSIVQDFVLAHCGTKFSENQWVENMLNRNSVSSFQVKVIEKLKKSNDENMKRLSQAKRPFSNTLKQDLVNKGAALYYISSQGPRAREFKDFACYIEGVYGPGRNFVLETAQTLTGVAATFLSLNPEFLALSGSTKAMAVTMAARSSLFVPVTIKMIQNGGCDDGLNGVVTAPICEQLKNSKSLLDRIQVVVRDYDDRMVCTSAAIEVAMNGNPFAKAMVGGAPGFNIKKYFPSERVRPGVINRSSMAFRMWRMNTPDPNIPDEAFNFHYYDKSQVAEAMGTRWAAQEIKNLTRVTNQASRTNYLFEGPVSAPPAKAQALLDKYFANDGVAFAFSSRFTRDEMVLRKAKEKFGSVDNLFKQLQINPVFDRESLAKATQGLAKGQYMSARYIVDDQGHIWVLFDKEGDRIMKALDYRPMGNSIDHENFEQLLLGDGYFKNIEFGTFNVRMTESGPQISNLTSRMNLSFPVEEYFEKILGN